jgi:putative Holliday junction resolvase
MRVLGVDPGVRRIGLAVADDEVGIASPHSTLDGGDTEKSARGLAAAAARLDVQKIVVGLALRLDGSVGEAARRAQQLADRLRALSGLEVVLWDERLTSKAAERALDAGGVRGRKRRKAVDPIAAALILQSYLDAERGRASNESGSHA